VKSVSGPAAGGASRIIVALSDVIENAVIRRLVHGRGIASCRARARWSELGIRQSIIGRIGVAPAAAGLLVDQSLNPGQDR